MSDWDDFAFGDTVDFAPLATFSDGCTQCGVCVNSCPTFRASHDPQQTPMARIRTLRELKDHRAVDASAYHSLATCLTCGTCEKVCPSKVDYVALLDDTIATLPDATREIYFRELILLKWCETKWIRQLAATALSLLTKLPYAFRFRLIGIVPKRWRKWVALADWKNASKRRPTSEAIDNTVTNLRVQLFQGCTTAVLQRNLSDTVVDVFQRVGIAVEIPNAQVCCGALHVHAGETINGNALAKVNVRTFGDSSLPIVTVATGCEKALLSYPRWLATTDYEQNNIDKFSDRIIDACEYLHQSKRLSNLTLQPIVAIAMVHLPCTVVDNAQYEKTIFELLQRIPNLTLKQYSIHLTRCCGAGGSHLITHANQANQIADPIVDELQRNKVNYWVTTNTGCAAHIRAQIAARSLAIEVLHPIELLARSIQ